MGSCPVTPENQGTCQPGNHCLCSYKYPSHRGVCKQSQFIYYTYKHSIYFPLNREMTRASEWLRRKIFRCPLTFMSFQVYFPNISLIYHMPRYHSPEIIPVEFPSNRPSSSPESPDRHHWHRPWKAKSIRRRYDCHSKHQPRRRRPSRESNTSPSPSSKHNSNQCGVSTNDCRSCPESFGGE